MKNLSLPLITLFFALAGMVSCHNPQKQPATPELVKVWETEAIFNVPESVCYDPEVNVLYVSNINGAPTDKDTNGFISKCNLDGSIIMLEWVTGLHAPKGMGIVGSKLYVTDIDRVAQIDLKSGEVLKFYEVPAANFLNDIAVDKSGNVYVSDMMDTKIYRISADTIGLWLDDKVLTSPNGLFVQDDLLLIGCQKIVKAGLSDGKIQEWVRETGGIDGLEGTGDGSYFFSDWQGNVYLLNNEQKIEKLIDLTTEKKNAADIAFNPVDNILYVPTFGANTVIAYKLNQ